MKEEQTHYGFIAISPSGMGGYYGLGDTVDEAKAKMKHHGGTLNHYLVYELPEESVDPWIDNFGSVHWTWREGYDGPMQQKLEVVAKRGVPAA